MAAARQLLGSCLEAAQKKLGSLEAAQKLGSCSENAFGSLEAARKLLLSEWMKLVLHSGCSNDASIAKWLAQKHGIVIIPGSGCGFPGYIRVAFGKPKPGEFEKAAARLHAGLKELAEKGPSAISQ